MNIEEQFAARLVELREKRNISARSMSLDLGQNAGYINNIESGKNFPSMTIFFYICEYLSITPEEFFDFDSKHPAELRELIDDLKKLDIVQLECIITIVRAFTQK